MSLNQSPASKIRTRAARRHKGLIYAALLCELLLCLIVAVVLAGAITPVSALFGLVSGVPAQAFSTTGAAMPSASPSATPAPSSTLTASETASATPTLTAVPSETLIPTDTPLPSETPTEIASPTALPTDTAEPMFAAPPAEPAASQAPVVPGGAANLGPGGSVHWIEVNLTQQMAYAYEGQTLVNTFVISSGVAEHLTVTGSYHVYERHIKGNMWGPGYFLPDVPYIMYFYKGYSLHGTYWHNNFGTPMSHGCVNLSIPDAEWLYSWSTIGTLVKIHY